MAAGIKKTFTLTGEIKEDNHVLIVAPSEKCEYPEVRIPITGDQWDALRFGFMTAHDDKNKGDVKTIPLAYVK